MEAKVKLAMAQLQIELIYRMKGTSLYKHKYKNLCKSIQDMNKDHISKLFDNMDLDAEMYFHKVVRMVESVMGVVENKDIDVFISLMEAFESGDISVVGDKDHSKILGQMEKA